MNRGVRILHTAIILLVLGITAQAQPALVKEISNESSNFTRAGDLVFYVDGSALYRTDGTPEGTILLKDGLVLPNYRRQMIAFKGLLFFTSNWSRTADYQEIWRSDGTPSGTYMLSHTAYVEILGGAGEYLYFRASEPGTGSELYRTDGTVSGTMLLKDINPGAASAGSHLLTAVEDVMFFAANDGVHGIELWKTDGSATGTVMVKDINAGPGDGIGQAIPASFNNKLYFSGITSDEGAEPWVSDGTSDGTMLLHNLLPGSDYPGFIEFTTNHNGWLYFFSSPLKDFGSGEITVDLWKTNGSSAATQKVKSLERCISCSYVEDYRVYKDKLYFFLHESWGEEILWATDGTEAGTTEIFSMPSFGTLPFFEELNGHLLFFGASGSIATPFYRSDGTSSGTEIFHTFKSAGFESISNIEDVSIVRIADRIYFPDHDGPSNNGYATNEEDRLQLMRSDGFTVESIRSIAGGSYSGVQNLVKLDERLIFSTSNVPPFLSEREARLWSFDPAEPIVSRGTLTLVNAETDEDVKTLNEGDVITKPEGASFNIRYNPLNEVGSVVFKHQGKIVRRENAAPYAIAGDNNGNYLVWSGAVTGDHMVEAIPYSGSNGSGTPGPSVLINFRIDPATSCASSRSILREYWGGVSGNTVSSIPVNTEPDATSQLMIFEGPTNAGTNYGSRIRGYICIPQSGAYTFWIASNDHSELWLSTDANPTNKQRIAYVTGSTNPRQWDKFASQRSAPIELVAGGRYYIEALHKQGVGTDHIAVGWQLPNGYTERPIAGSRLSPFSGHLTPMVTITSPDEGQVFPESSTIAISGTIDGLPGGGNTVELYAGSLPIGLSRYNSDSFTFEWRDVPSGAYPLKAVVTDFEGRTATSEVVNIVVEASCSALGRIGREYWNGVQGTAVTDIPLEEPPSGSNELPAFEMQAGGTNYGARIRGYICAPTSGEYIFWISSNDHSELWISTDDDPVNKQRIAYANAATGFRQWNKFASQRSAPVLLTQGKRYYIEALHKQGVGTDHISVGWQLPDGSQERPIEGSRLSPFGEENDGNSYLLYPASGASGIDPLVMKLEVRRVIGAERYTVELSPDADFSGDIVSISSIEDFQSELIIKNLESGTTYHARVKTNESGYGPVTTFTTRDGISRLRLWGLTTSGGGGGLGSVFSYSINDNTFTKHYVQHLVSDGYDGFYEQRLMGTLVPGPEGMAYGHNDHDYSAAIFTLHEDGSVKEWMSGAYFQDGKLFLASNNILYATNNDELGPGVIDKYRVEDESLLLDERMEFFQQQSNGSNPGSPLIELPDGYLYGTARSGGINEGGLIFKFNPSGKEFQIVHHFNQVGSGMNPAAGLTEYNGFLYGTTRHGGEGGNKGTIFRIKADGSQFMKLHDFNGFNGAHPEAELVILNDLIYGTTKEGGNADEGVVFRISINGSVFLKLHDFSGLDGAKPARGLVADRDGNFYGMTTEGGENHSGVIYRINDTGFLKLLDFSSSTGGAPNGALLLREDTYMGSPSMAASTTSAETLSVSIHPNPSTDNFNIMVSSPGSEAIQLVITDQYGQQVAMHRITPDSPVQFGDDLKRGVYIMKVIQGKEITMQRLVKK